VEAVRRLAAGVRPIETIHAMLRSEDTQKWARVRAALPSWVFAQQSVQGLAAAHLPEE
jgi:hypothetical protein